MCSRALVDGCSPSEHTSLPLENANNIIYRICLEEKRKSADLPKFAALCAAAFGRPPEGEKHDFVEKGKEVM